MFAVFSQHNPFPLPNPTALRPPHPKVANSGQAKFIAMRYYQPPRPALSTADVAMLGHHLLIVGAQPVPGSPNQFAAAELNMRTLTWEEVAVARGVGEGGGTVSACTSVKAVAFHGALMVYAVEIGAGE